jgi:hypothetical protein
MMMTVLSMSMVTAIGSADAATAEAGDLIKMEGLSSVYYLGEDGKRYVFPNEDTYFSWYSDFSSVVTISQSELESYPLGSNVNIRPGTHLVKITTDPKVYAVEEGGSLRAIPDEDTAETLYGANWADRVVDVPDAFFVNYTIDEGNEVSADAYPQGTLVKPQGGSDVYYINADGEAQPIADEAAFEANRFQWEFVTEAASDYNLPTQGAEIVSANEDLVDPSEGTSGEATGPVGSGLSVALASDTPASASMPLGTVPAFAKYNFTASNDGAVEVESLKLKRIGVGDKAELGKVYLYSGTEKLTNARTISASNGTVSFNGVDLSVPAGETQSITVRATVTGTGTSGSASGNHGFAIQEASAVGTDGASVSGSFPIQGNVMSASSVDGGDITYEYTNVADATLKVGDTKEEVSEIEIRANSGEDVILHQVTLTNEGSADPNDLKNFKLYNGSTLLAEKESNDSDALTMTLDEPLTIEENSNETITLEADIMGGVDTGAIQYEVDDNTDIIAVGNEYGYVVDVQPYDGSQSVPSQSIIEIQAGELTFEIDGPASQEVTKDAEDVNMSNLTVTTAGNEDIIVEELHGKIDMVTTSTDEDISDNIENVQLINVDEGDVYDVTRTDNDGDEIYNFKVENFTIPAGETNWRVEVDFIETNVKTDQEYMFKMTADTTNVVAENADGETIEDVKPGATIEGNKVTIKEASLAASAGNLSDGDVVARAKGVKLMKFTVDAGSAENVKVTDVGLTANSGDLTVNTSNFTLVDSSDNVLETGVSAADSTTVNFSDINDGNGLIVSADETKTLYVKADITSSASGDIQLALDSITAETVEDGDTVNVSGASFNGRTVTVQTQGTLTLSEDNSSPDSGHIWLSNSTENEALAMKAEAEYEDLKITDLQLDSFSAGTSSIAAIHLYQDGELVDTIDNVAGSAVTFNNIDMVIDDAEDSILSIKVDAAGIGNDAEDTASSSDEISFGVGDVTYEGVSSLNEDTDSSVSITSNAYTVYASKVTATTASNQPSTLSSGVKEALKVTLTPDTNDNKTAQLASTTVNYSLSDSDGSGLQVDYVYLYSGGQELASAASSTAVNGAVKLDLSTADNISSDGETYTVKLDVEGASADDKITTSLNVNGGADSDDIGWYDYDYTNKSSIDWIDLGENSDLTQIENTINY